MNTHSTLKTLSAALATAAVTLLAVPSAQAAVVVVTPTTPISITNSIDGIYMNLVTGVTGASAAAVPGWDFNPYNNGAGLTFYGAASPSGILATGTPGTTAVAQLLSAGSTISATSTGFYNQFQTVGTGGFQTAGSHYLGLRFLNESTSTVNYGYALIQTGAPSTTGFPASIISYAYENTGLGITIPAVPEPSTFAMFGIALAGAAGVNAWKRRRAA